MTRILVLYGTTDGHTARIADTIAHTLRARGASVEVQQAGRTDDRPEGYDGVIVAAPVRAGRYQKSVRHWVRRHAEALNQRTTAFVSVSLGVLQHDAAVDSALRAIVDGLLSETGWRPTIIKPVAGALLYTRYSWFVRRMMRRIAAKAGGGTDTTRDYEYTDWPDLRRFTEQFALLVVQRLAASMPYRASA